MTLTNEESENEGGTRDIYNDLLRVQAWLLFNFVNIHAVTSAVVRPNLLKPSVFYEVEQLIFMWSLFVADNLMFSPCHYELHS